MPPHPPHTPPLHPLHDPLQLRTNCPDFKLVDEACRVTRFWLQCCLRAGTRMPPLARTAPCYRPLPYVLPLPGMEDVK